MTCVQGLHCILFGCGMVIFDFNDILQGYSSGTGQIKSPSTNEATLTNMIKQWTRIRQEL